MKAASLKNFFSLKKDSSKLFVNNLLERADIKINGDRPWDIQVHNENLYSRVMSQGSLGLGKSYMDGWWDCQALDQFFFKVLDAGLEKKVGLNWSTIINILKAKLINLQSNKRALEVAERHYDLDLNLYQNMLDSNLQYTSAYWQHASNLDEAQEHKMDLICKKLQLKPGMKVLDIGCGWGGLARYAAEKYKVEVVEVNISKEQVAYAKQFCGNLPITIIEQDYRDIQGTFDRIASICMINHVGYKNCSIFMEVVYSCLKDGGLFLLQTVSSNKSQVSCDSWTNKYIFPNGYNPSIKQLGQSIEGLFVMEDWHNFGADYDKTLMAWHDRFNKNWDTIKLRFDERFYRMWNYYLLSCAGGFRARDMQLWQIVFSKKGVKGGYTSIR